MPLYEYKCSACEQVSEIQHKISESGPEICPCCQAEGKMQKLISQTSFVLKGGGWYTDAYSSKPDKPKKDGDSTKSTKKDSVTGDKPAEKKTPKKSTQTKASD